MSKNLDKLIDDFIKSMAGGSFPTRSHQQSKNWQKDLKSDTGSTPATTSRATGRWELRQSWLLPTP